MIRSMTQFVGLLLDWENKHESLFVLLFIICWRRRRRHARTDGRIILRATFPRLSDGRKNETWKWKMKLHKTQDKGHKTTETIVLPVLQLYYQYRLQYNSTAPYYACTTAQQEQINRKLNQMINPPWPNPTKSHTRDIDEGLKNQTISVTSTIWLTLVTHPLIQGSFLITMTDINADTKGQHLV